MPINKDLERDYYRYKRLCEQYNEKPVPMNDDEWLSHYNHLLEKDGVHYNR